MEEIVKICKNCKGHEPCLCDKHDYVVMDKWVYETMKKLKPMG